MSGSLFIPKIKQEATFSAQPKEVPQDSTSEFLMKIARYAVVGLLLLLPLFFTPGLLASLGFDKSMLALTLGVTALITTSLLALRKQSVRTVLPIPLGLFWAVVLAAFASGLLSGDVQDALRGSVFEVQTVSFLALLGLVMTVTLVLQDAKSLVIRAFMAFFVVAAVTLLYVIVRVLLDATFLPFGSFGAVTTSPLGGFNDIAIFSGLMIIFGVITLLMVPLRTWMQGVISTIVIMALVMLAVVNFFKIWVIIGFFGLLVFMYIMSRDTLFRRQDDTEYAPAPRLLIVVTAFICVVSALFVVAGEFAGARIAEMTNISYVEVRPSVGATLDIAGAVYGENVLLGAGPNRFADAWRLYKDASINETIFWDTDFTAGSGYIPTLFITLGLLGGVLIAAFHGWFMYVGARMLLRTEQTDAYWFYIGVVSFTASLFLWLMTYLYVPGATLLLLAAFFTGLTFVAQATLVPQAAKVLTLASNRRRGFFLMGAIILIITGAIASVFTVGEQYVAAARFTEAQLTATSVAEFDQAAQSAFTLYQDDRILNVRAQLELSTLNSLLAIPEPTEENRQQFLATAERGMALAQEAVRLDDTNPDNHAILGGIYSVLAAAGYAEAREPAEAALATAQSFNPFNPGYRLMSASMAVRSADIERARTEIGNALALKRNYTEALFLSAQLDINEGNTEAAIATTRAIITIEPNNPTRYFQLGVLLSANDQLEEALAAYQAALTLDPQNANARYLQSLTLIDLGRYDEALAGLRIVLETNQDNEQLKTLIAQLESGADFTAPNLGLETPVSEVGPESDGDAVTTPGSSDTDLVTPVNTVSEIPEETPDTETTPGE